MARTKASVGSKVSAGKSSKARCSVAPAPSSSGGSGSSDRSSRGSSGGGNTVCQRETPKWQKPITKFFISKDGEKGEDIVDVENEDQEAGSSKQKPKKNIIESDDEEILAEKPKNNVLDETIELEPLNGEDSHKIEEYYTKGNKGKGIGKRSKGKENRRDSKRVREEEEEEETVNKKVRVNDD